jgi:hypothetical protein
MSRSTNTDRYYADSTLFNVFTLPAIFGNTKTALNAPNSVVITESTARKYFGTPDVVGKTLEVNKAHLYRNCRHPRYSAKFTLSFRLYLLDEERQLRLGELSDEQFSDVCCTKRRD